MRLERFPGPLNVFDGLFSKRKEREKKESCKMKQEEFEKCWSHSPLRAAARFNFTLPFTRCRYCRTPPLSPAHRCPRRRRRQQRQRVTEGTAMADYRRLCSQLSSLALIPELLVRFNQIYISFTKIIAAFHVPIGIPIVQRVLERQCNE